MASATGIEQESSLTAVPDGAPDIRVSTGGRVIFYGFLCTFWAVVLALTTYTKPEDLKWLILDIAAPTLAVSWLLLRVMSGRTAIRHDLITWAALASLAAQAFSLLGATNVGLGVLDISRHVGLVALYFLAANAPANDRDRDRALWAVAACGSIVSLYGIAQHFGYDFFPWIEHIEVPTRRGVSTIGHGTFAASFLIMAIPLTLGLALSRATLAGSAAALSIAVLMLIHLSFTGARGATLALAVAVAITAVMAIRAAGRQAQARFQNLRRLGIAAVTIVVLAAAAYTVAAAWREKESDALAVTEGGTALRIYTWETASRLFLGHWVNGVGVGNYAIASPAAWNEQEALRFFEYHRLSTQVHNEYLEAAAEQGIIGLGAFMLLVMAALRQSLRNVRLASDPRAKRLALAVFAAVVAALIDAVGIFNLQVAAPAALFWLILGLLTYSQARELRNPD